MLSISSLNLDKVYQFLFIFLGFAIPLSTALGNIIAILICLIWLLSGDYSKKFSKIIENKFAIASILFFFIHILGMLWTENIAWGLVILKKMSDFFIYIPIFLTIVKKENIPIYIGAFLSSIFITEIISYMILFEFIEPFKNASIKNPTPFMSSISHGPFMAFSFYIFSRLFIHFSSTFTYRYIFLFLAIITAGSVFLIESRAGHVVFFTMLLVLFFQYFGLNLKSLKEFSYAAICVLILAFNFSPVFKDRVSKAIGEFESYQINKDSENSSVGLRLAFAENSYEIIKENLLIGVGTGDFPDEYRKVHSKNTPSLVTTTNPHNMYILVITQLGILGLLFFLYIFYTMYKLSMQNKETLYRDLGVSLLSLYLVINLSDSYLLGHFTTFMFVYFAAFIFSHNLKEDENCPDNNSKV